MSFLDDISTPVRVDVVVSFTDLASWSRWARTRSDVEMFANLSAWYGFVDERIVSSGGRCVKCIGDAVLAVHPLEGAGEAVRSLVGMQEDGDRWLSQHMPGCRHQIKIHAGPAVCGLLGPPTGQRLDIVGETVNACAALPSHGLALSVAAFRALDPNARKLFKKHTPPVTYIPVMAAHRDP